ncbi:hypothetical protein [Variovorax paradoxus]|uniref:hypothetical protein n=1 Tax=Variovorax paradoxus TaxID=34073 RepID=UPI0012D4A918|nr:hypothetical protein [Variovorax paradoxus]
MLIRDIAVSLVVANERTSHEYNYQSQQFDSYQLLKVLQLAMFAMTTPRSNTNVYHHQTHADRRSMGLLARACPPLSQSVLSEQGKKT